MTAPASQQSQPVVPARTYPKPRQGRQRPPSIGETHYTARLYREGYGWAVDETGSLQMGGGIVGVLVQAIFAGATAEYLQRQESCGPVLELGLGVDGWLFLADPNELVLSQSEMPPGVSVLGCPYKVPLPTPANRGVRWIKPPRSRARWLPTLATVLAAAVAASPS